MRLFSYILAVFAAVAITVAGALLFSPQLTEATASDGADSRPDAVVVESNDPIRQISWMAPDAGTDRVEYRALEMDTNRWTRWQPVEVTFREADAYNARVLFEDPVEAVEVQGGDHLQRVEFSVQSEVTARRTPLDAENAEQPQHALACSEQDPYLTLPDPARFDDPQLPDELVTPRDGWGAIAPERVCRRAEQPARTTFHHTAIPADSGDDPTRAIRQVQSYHLNERGWCDIGYHFLIAEDGEIFEGSAKPHRLAAHVGGDNEGNVGIALIGDFTAGSPTDAQLEAATRLLNWLHRAYDIPLRRAAVRGHHEWPGQYTSCPGDEFQPVLDDIVETARNHDGDEAVQVRRIQE